MTTQRWTTGALLHVQLSDGQIVKAQMLDEPEFVFFNPKDGEKVLFRLWVHKSAYNTGRWPKVGRNSVAADLRQPIARFKQDPISGRLSICSREQDLPASLEECAGLERAAVWDPEHVESRLEDALAGRPNKWVESLRIDEDKIPE